MINKQKVHYVPSYCKILVRTLHGRNPVLAGIYYASMGGSTSHTVIMYFHHMSAAMHKWLLAYLLPTAWLIESWLLLFIVYVSWICWYNKVSVFSVITCSHIMFLNVPSICALTFEGDLVSVKTAIVHQALVFTASPSAARMSYS